MPILKEIGNNKIRSNLLFKSVIKFILKFLQLISQMNNLNFSYFLK